MQIKELHLNTHTVVGPEVPAAFELGEDDPLLAVGKSAPDTGIQRTSGLHLGPG